MIARAKLRPMNPPPTNRHTPSNHATSSPPMPPYHGGKRGGSGERNESLMGMPKRAGQITPLGDYAAWCEGKQR